MAGRRRFSDILKLEIITSILERRATVEDVKNAHSVKVGDVQRWLGEYVIVRLAENSEAKFILSNEPLERSPEEQRELIGLKAQNDLLQEFLFLFVNECLSKDSR